MFLITLDSLLLSKFPYRVVYDDVEGVVLIFVKEDQLPKVLLIHRKIPYNSINDLV